MDTALQTGKGGFGMPLHPFLYGVVGALVATRAGRKPEEKTGIPKSAFAGLVEKDGLGPATFEKAWSAARPTGFMGKNSPRCLGGSPLTSTKLINRCRFTRAHSLIGGDRSALP